MSDLKNFTTISEQKNARRKELRSLLLKAQDLQSRLSCLEKTLFIYVYSEYIFLSTGDTVRHESERVNERWVDGERGTDIVQPAINLYGGSKAMTKGNSHGQIVSLSSKYYAESTRIRIAQ